MMGTYYRICEFCGSNLDPGERCDCQRVRDSNDNKREKTTYGRIQIVYAESGVAGEKKTAAMDRQLFMLHVRTN